MKLPKETLPEGYRHLNEDELALHIAVMMAADARGVPILRGKGVRRDQVDELRHDFAKWLAGRILAHDVLTVVHGPPVGAHSFGSWRGNSCPACGAAAYHA